MQGKKAKREPVKKPEGFFRLFWYYLAKDEGPIGWVVSALVAFVVIKFLILPGLGFMLGTSFPLVAVVSGSMEHHAGFDDWWAKECSASADYGSNGEFYEQIGISKPLFEDFSFTNGMNTGDLIIIRGADDVSIGDVIVFNAGTKYDPIIHRVIQVKSEGENKLYITKGDNNCKSAPFEENTPKSQILGKAVFRIPWLGYVKKIFEDILRWIGLDSVISFFR